LTVYAGVTMVSSVKFYSGKDINLRRMVPFWVAILILLALLLISIEPSHVLWGIALCYGLSGYVGWFVHRWRIEAFEKKYENIRDAIEEGNVTALARMLGATTPKAVIASGGRSLMMVAVEETNLPAIQLPIQRGAALNQRDDQGMTALALAAEMGFREAVEILLLSGADPNVLDLLGLTALDVAEEHGAHDISSELLRFGAKSSKELAPSLP